ncbi:MAG TPA: ChbG/HpnK family deacetylase [Accumulibacter sp.]|nr:ChbG/HpnK family deacetylase [Accumulibacter sp.]HNC17814.1 ChbG/HpnK family deacetylase [Accumulibacter sp.]HND80141.1 ChbG/HpnK family deacetylase [Accumulibacter sp.]HNE12820.1 ChbG/HpnK family deacetylase [Accumulibacter sp.]HNG39189.1 ChbG/HpnK family deacetylase [Accumulibacter sp.]
MKRLVICADDFGMSAAVDQGIVELAAGGCLSAVSCLADAPELRSRAAALRALPVDIGLHLNFTERFDDETFFLPLPRLIVSSYLGRLDRQMVIEAIDRQCQRFEEHFVGPPHFIDGHQHVHQLPIIRHALLEVIGRRYPGRALWLRSTRVRRGVNPRVVRPGYTLKATIIATLGERALRRLVSTRGWRMNDSLLGVYDFSASEQQYAALLDGWFDAAHDGDLLMCHPAKSATAGDPLGEQRVREYTVLSAPRFADRLATRGLQLGRLSSIAG